ncbi:ankyrin repeat domain-containing protein [Streptomyces sp. NPDC042898]|uniref:ankyrin repeat domain-containing protein n=1 Tax=unclassified Streptomyces TaxID=2593676 RepID=UPI003331E6A6
MRDDDRRLLAAARRGDAGEVRAALDAGARVEARDEELRSPLLLAALGDHVEAAHVLVAAGADPNAQDRRHDSAWLVTGVTGSVTMMRALLPAGPDTALRNRFGGVSLIPASERGHVAYVRAVLRETDVDVDHVNDLGWTALLEAVILGDGGRPHQEVVELLLAAGADPELADADGVTPLRHARRRGFDAIAALLTDV